MAAMSDQNVADPVDSFADGVIIPVINFLIHMVKTKMPLDEIRRILSPKYAALIETAITQEQFLEATFEVSVLAGQKLAARAGIQQLIPFFMQILQQPQLLQFLHERGETVDFAVIANLLLQVGELQQQPDIFRKLTKSEIKMLMRMSQGAQKAQAAVQTETVRGSNKLREIRAKGETDLANKAAEIALEHTSNGIPLERAMGLVERRGDAQALTSGFPDVMQE